jgi:hypothetical protein
MTKKPSRSKKVWILLEKGKVVAVAPNRNRLLNENGFDRCPSCNKILNEAYRIVRAELTYSLPKRKQKA